MFYKVIFIVLFFTISAFAQNDIKNIKSFKSNFTQTITSGSSDKITYQGEVFIKNSGKILWKYNSPIIKNVYINNNSAIIDEPELEQAIFTNLENDINIIKLLNESIKVNENLYSSTVDKVNYKIYLKNKVIDKITYEDELENSIDIQFFDINQNIELNDSLFIFIAPSDYDLIRR